MGRQPISDILFLNLPSSRNPALVAAMDIEALEQAQAVSPDNIPLCLLLADAYLGAFSIEDAVKKFEHVISLEPKNPAAKVGLAQALELSGKTSEAILRLEQVCADTPDYAPAWIQRAKFALSEGEAQAARGFYDRAVKINSAAADKDLLQRIIEAEEIGRAHV